LKIRGEKKDKKKQFILIIMKICIADQFF